MSTVDCSSRTGDGVPMATARAAPSAWRKKMCWSTLTSAHSAAVLGRQALSLVSQSLSAIYACALVLGTCYIEADDVVSSAAELGGEVIINQLFILRQASLSFVRCRSCVVIIRETSAWCVVLVAAQHLYFTALPVVEKTISRSYLETRVLAPLLRASCSDIILVSVWCMSDNFKPR